MFKENLKIEFQSSVNRIKKIIKRSKELISENSELSEPEARKIASEELTNEINN